jgi:hypothetical protein
MAKRWKSPYTAEERKAWGEAKKLERQAREIAEAQAWEYGAKILPELEGTDAQIAWAIVIRHDILHEALASYCGLKPEFFGENWEEMLEGQGPEAISAIAYIREWALPLIKEKSAKWWIEHRELKALNAEYTITHWGDIYNASLVQAAKDEKIAELKARKPERPECLKKAFSESPVDATWNLKVYGSARYNNLRFYISDREFTVTKEEAVELENWVKARAAWRKELEEVEA